MITFDDTVEYGAKMRIVGIGGGGCNAINTMIESSLTGVEFVAINTDMQALAANRAQQKVQIGRNLTRGLGAGANPEIGKRAAEEDIDQVRNVLEGSDLVFITCGMGGGTGTGSAAVVAEAAQSIGALTIGIVTKPFHFEKEKRMSLALNGIEALREHVDTLIVIPNEKLLMVMPKNTPFIQAFKAADEVLFRATKGIADLISCTGYVNVDFADVKKIMSGAGDAIMGMGVGTGERRGEEAVKQAINSPLLDETTIEGASGVLLNLTCPSDFTTEEVAEISNLITNIAGPDADVIWGYSVDEKLKGEVHVTVIAAGLNRQRFGKMKMYDTTASEGPNPLSISKRAAAEASTYYDHLRDMKTRKEMERPAIQRMDEAAPDEAHDDDSGQILKKTGTDGLEDRSIPTFLRNHTRTKK
ncbi:MAG: cell division protein FtsZ [Bacteroidetes bacterium]|nr:cell division protein FtsZ [Bacteroidota bacterium]